MIRLDVTQGLASGSRHESSADVVRVGRATGNDMVLPDELVSGEHARIVFGDEKYLLRDLRSTNGTAVLRATTRIALDDTNGRELALEAGDVVELGGGEQVVRFTVTIETDLEGDARVLAMRKIDELGPAESAIERDSNRLRALYDVQKRIGGAADMNDVLVAICDGAFALLHGATHVTVVLREDDDGTSSYVPIVTRVRDQQGPATHPIPVTRSVFRKVVSERAAVIAADAPSEVGTDRVDHGRVDPQHPRRPALAGRRDPRRLAGRQPPERRRVHERRRRHGSSSSAPSASLAVANARLIKRLASAEDRLKKENSFLKGAGGVAARRQGRAGDHRQAPEPMRHVFEQLDKVVDTRVTVLIEGETGVGKELIAAAVHYRSRRRDKLFVSQNCAAIAESLLESELFGHKKGSFTGAHEEKKGLFEIADGGTLFLDEMTETPLSLQIKLLRALQEGEIRAVGATQREARQRADRRARPTGTSRKRSPRGASARTSTTASRCSPSASRPCASAARTSRSSPRTSSSATSTEIGKPVGGFSQQAMELLPGLRLARQRPRAAERGAAPRHPDRARRLRHAGACSRRASGRSRALVDRVEADQGHAQGDDGPARALASHRGAARAPEQQDGRCPNALGITREGLHKKLRGFGL